MSNDDFLADMWSRSLSYSDLVHYANKLNLSPVPSEEDYKKVCDQWNERMEREIGCSPERLGIGEPT